MTKHRALIVGAGRIGVGFNWPAYPYPYTHADAYRALPHRVELTAIVEKDEERRIFGSSKYSVPGYSDLRSAMAHCLPDVVSVCVQPEQQRGVLDELDEWGFNGGIWCEKPFVGTMKHRNHLIQVNYIRRFDAFHQAVASHVQERESHLTVWAKNDHNTRCHFENLAYWWGSKLTYIDNSKEIPSTNHYTVTTGKTTISFENGGMTDPMFMVKACENLLDAMEDKAQLFSPAY